MMSMFTFLHKSTLRISWQAEIRKLSHTSISGMQCNLLAFLFLFPLSLRKDNQLIPTFSITEPTYMGMTQLIK